MSVVETQDRFQLAFREFIGVFARADQPLTLFRDDRQWLDSGGLALLENIIMLTSSTQLWAEAIGIANVTTGNTAVRQRAIRAMHRFIERPLSQ